MILTIGNIYVDFNYFSVDTAGSDYLQEGSEYGSRQYEIVLGGSVLNFIKQAQVLGLETGLIAKRNNDVMGNILAELLKQKNIISDLIAVDPTVQTAVNTGVNFAHNGNNTQIYSGDANQKLTISDIDFNNPIWTKVTTVYLGGYFKQEQLYADYPTLLKRLSDSGIKVYLDHGRVPVNVTTDKFEKLFESFKHIYCYLANESEITAVSKEQDVTKALESLANKYQIPIIVAKLGEKGAQMQYQGKPYSVSGYPIKAVNTIGAGDTFNAGFIYALQTGKTPEEALKIANRIAAYKVAVNEYSDYETIKSWIENIQ